MLTDAQRRYAHAKHRIQSELVDPVTELLDAAHDMVQETKRKAEQAQSALEGLRPVWAQGWASDSMAAQMSSFLLGELWQLLGVDNQITALERLRHLLTLEWGESPLPSLEERGRGTWHPGDEA